MQTTFFVLLFSIILIQIPKSSFAITTALKQAEVQNSDSTTSATKDTIGTSSKPLGSSSTHGVTKSTGGDKSTKGPTESSECSESSEDDAMSSQSPRPSDQTKDTKPSGATKVTKSSDATKATKSSAGTKATKPPSNGTSRAHSTGAPHATGATHGATKRSKATHEVSKTSRRTKSTKKPQDSSESSDDDSEYRCHPRPPPCRTKANKSSGVTKSTKPSVNGTKKAGVTSKPVHKTSKGSKHTERSDESSSSDGDEDVKKSTGKPKPSNSSKGKKFVKSTKVTCRPVTRKSGVSTKRTQTTQRKGPVGCGLSKEGCEIDCENGHKISLHENKVVGVLIINNCSNKPFSKDLSNAQAVIKQLSELVNRQLTKKGIKELPNVEFIKSIGDKTHTQFHYSIDAKKQYHDEIKAALHVVCKEKELRYTIDEHQRQSCDEDSSSSDTSDSDQNKDHTQKTRRPHTGSKSDLSDSSSEENKPKPILKTQVGKHQTGHITRVLSTSAYVLFTNVGQYNSACARCALRKISSTLLLEGVTLKEVSTRLCGRFPLNFKYTLAAEIRKYQTIGLKSIQIITISTDEKQNLIIEFDIIVDPQYNQLVHNALRYAVVSLDLQRVFKCQKHY